MGTDRRRLLLDHALADAAPAGDVRAAEPGHAPPLAGAAAARAGGAGHQGAGPAGGWPEGAGRGGRHHRGRDRGAEGARAPGPGGFHRGVSSGAGRPRSTRSTATTCRRYLSFFVRTPGSLAGGRGREHRRRAGAAGRAGHPGGQRERREVTERWPPSWAAPRPRSTWSSTPSGTTPRCSRWARWGPRCSCS